MRCDDGQVTCSGNPQGSFWLRMFLERLLVILGPSSAQPWGSR